MTKRANPTLEDLAHDAAMFAQVAQVLIDNMLGHTTKNAQGMIEITPWETDILIFSVHQAKFSAEEMHEAYAAAEHSSLDGGAS